MDFLIIRRVRKSTFWTFQNQNLDETKIYSINSSDSVCSWCKDYFEKEQANGSHI